MPVQRIRGPFQVTFNLGEGARPRASTPSLDVPINERAERMSRPLDLGALVRRRIAA
jgi:hypothetical protein